MDKREISVKWTEKVAEYKKILTELNNKELRAYMDQELSKFPLTQWGSEATEDERETYECFKEAQRELKAELLPEEFAIVTKRILDEVDTFWAIDISYPEKAELYFTTAFKIR